MSASDPTDRWERYGPVYELQRWAHSQAVWGSTAMMLLNRTEAIVSTRPYRGQPYRSGSEALIPADVVPPRFAGIAAAGDFVVFVGGYETTNQDRIILFDTAARQQDAWDVVVDNGYPQKALGAGSVWTGQEWFLWGGAYNDGAGAALYDPDDRRWRMASREGQPDGSTRTSPVVAWTGSEVIVFAKHYFEAEVGALRPSTGIYDPVADRWRPIAPPPAPGFDFHNETLAGVWTGEELFVIARSGGDGISARYDPRTDTWRSTNIEDAPRATDVAQRCAVADCRVVVPGKGGLHVYDLDGDTWSLIPIKLKEGYVFALDDDALVFDPVTRGLWLVDLRTGEIMPRSLDGARSPRSQAAIAWTGRYLLMLGGRTPNESGETWYFIDGAIYDAVTDTWSDMPLRDGPGRRAAMAAAWTGDRFLVWGGYAVPLSTHVFFDTGAMIELDLPRD